VHLSGAVYEQLPVQEQSNCAPWATDSDRAVRGASEPGPTTAMAGEAGTTFVLYALPGDPMTPVLEPISPKRQPKKSSRGPIQHFSFCWLWWRLLWYLLC
jgi:hypothetical protein